MPIPLPLLVPFFYYFDDILAPLVLYDDFYDDCDPDNTSKDRNPCDPSKIVSCVIDVVEKFAFETDRPQVFAVELVDDILFIPSGIVKRQVGDVVGEVESSSYCLSLVVEAILNHLVLEPVVVERQRDCPADYLYNQD